MKFNTNKWSHLPNAEHIGWVLASVKANPGKWGAAWDAAWDAAWYAAWDAAWDAAWYAARDAARDAAWNAAWNAARDAAGGTILGLIAYDHSARYLTMTPDRLLVTYYLSNDPACLLLLPAARVRESLDKLTNEYSITQTADN